MLLLPLSWASNSPNLLVLALLLFAGTCLVVSWATEQGNKSTVTSWSQLSSKAELLVGMWPFTSSWTWLTSSSCFLSLSRCFLATREPRGASFFLFFLFFFDTFSPGALTHCLRFLMHRRSKQSVHSWWSEFFFYIRPQFPKSQRLNYLSCYSILHLCFCLSFSYTVSHLSRSPFTSDLCCPTVYLYLWEVKGRSDSFLKTNTGVTTFLACAMTGCAHGPGHQHHLVESKSTWLLVLITLSEKSDQELLLCWFFFLLWFVTALFVASSVCRTIYIWLKDD